MKRKKVYLGYTEVRDKILNSPHCALIENQKEFYTTTKFTEDLVHERYYYNCLAPSFPGITWDRYISGIKRMAEGHFVPLMLDLVVTGKCHCNCWHCFRGDYQDQRELSVKTIERVLSDAQEMGTAIVGITGGEPLLRKDIMDILRLIPSSMEGLLYSTGIHFHEQFVQELAETRITRCFISLDHYEREKVNKMRGFSHAYDYALNALQLLSDANIYTGVTLCATEGIDSVEEFWRYMDFVYSLDCVDEIRIVLPIPQGNLKGKDFKRFYRDVIRWTREAKKKADQDTDYPNVVLFNEYESEDYVGCGAGYTYLTVNNDGAITPCVCVPLSISNVNDVDLKTAYAEYNKFFTTTGCTCYGRRTSQFVPKDGGDSIPLPENISRDIIEKCIVKDGNASYYRNVENMINKA